MGPAGWNNFIAYQANGPNPNGQTLAVVDTARAHSGTKSVHIHGGGSPAEITRAAPFYSDLREKHVAVKGLRLGDVLEFSGHWHCAKPLAPGQFWYAFNFSHDAIILKQELQISVPRDRPLKWKSPDLKPLGRESRENSNHRSWPVFQ